MESQEIFSQAKAKLSKILGLNVSDIGIGLEKQRKNELDADGRQDELVRITLSDDRIQTGPAEMRDLVRKRLQDIPLIAQHVALEENAEHATHIKEALSKLIDAGADIDRRVLEWKGFDPELAKHDTYHICDHALEVVRSDRGLAIRIQLDKSESDKQESVNEETIVADNIRERLPEIKETLVKRLQKYLPDESADTIKQAVEQLQANVVTDSWGQDNVTITLALSSPEQHQTLVADKKLNDDEFKNLRETNILTRRENGLSDEQLGKALGRALLHGGETAKDIFPIIAGREDMKRAISKKLKKFAEANPDKAAEATAVLNDDIFKEHRWQGKDQLKQPALFNKCPCKENEMTVDLYVPAGKAFELVEALATGKTSPGFASVDSLELVGCQCQNKALQQEVGARIAPLVGTQVSGAQMDALAQQLTGHIEAAQKIASEGVVTQQTALQQEAPTPQINLMELLKNVRIKSAPEFSLGV